LSKIRSKGVGDEEADYALPIYAARSPVSMVIGEVEPCPGCSMALGVQSAWLASRRAGDWTLSCERTNPDA